MGLLSALLLAGCPGSTIGDDASPGSSSAATSMGPDVSESLGSGTASDTTASSDPDTSSTIAPEDSTTGGPIACDPEACEPLDLETCAACEPTTCGVLSGYPWVEEGDTWCLDASVPIACQVGAVCFDYYLTLCDDMGQAFYVDTACGSFDFEAAGLTLCEPPRPDEVFCGADE